MIGPIYNIPIMWGELAIAVTGNNEIILANAMDLEVANSFKVNNQKQLWVEEWMHRPVLRNEHEVYDLSPSSTELTPLWKQNNGKVLLMPDNKIISVKPTSWRNPVLNISCFDITGNNLLWSVKDDRFSFIGNLAGLPLAKRNETHSKALINMMDGSIDWEFKSPVADGELRLCFADEKRVYFFVIQPEILACGLCKLDRKSGELSWMIGLPEPGCKYDPIRNQFVSFSSGKLTLIDADTGQILVDEKEVLSQPYRQIAYKVALDPSAGKLVFDDSSESTVIGVYDYVNLKLMWVSPFCDIGNLRVGKLWFNNGRIHIFDSMNMLRVGRDEGSRLII